MRTSLKTEELVALRFPNLEGHRACVQTYTEGRPKGYFASAGRGTSIIPRADERWLLSSLAERGITAVEEVPLRSISELPPEEAALVRQRRGFRRAAAEREEHLNELRRRRTARRG
jgi:hypothetical protein